MPMAGQANNYMSPALSDDKTNEKADQMNRAVEKAKAADSSDDSADKDASPGKDGSSNKSDAK